MKHKLFNFLQNYWSLFTIFFNEFYFSLWLAGCSKELLLSIYFQKVLDLLLSYYCLLHSPSCFHGKSELILLLNFFEFFNPLDFNLLSLKALSFSKKIFIKFEDFDCFSIADIHWIIFENLKDSILKYMVPKLVYFLSLFPQNFKALFD